jgi:hypothetical protein
MVCSSTVGFTKPETWRASVKWSNAVVYANDLEKFSRTNLAAVGLAKPETWRAPVKWIEWSRAL